MFPERRVFPFRFPLRHYPIRNSTLGKKKAFSDRLPRFMPEEQAIGWHVQYNRFQNDCKFLGNAQKLKAYDVLRVREEIAERTHEKLKTPLARPENGQESILNTFSSEEAGVEEVCNQMSAAGGFLKLNNLALVLEKSKQQYAAVNRLCICKWVLAFCPVTTLGAQC